MFFTRAAVRLTPLLIGLTLTGDLVAQQSDRSRSPAHRARLTDSGDAPTHEQADGAARAQRLGARFPFEFRSIDGHGNNSTHPEWGAAGQPFLRLMEAAYADSVSEPSGAARPSARSVSNALAAQPAPVHNRSRSSDYLWQWGQFLDHDINETPVAAPAEAFDIHVPLGDPWFDPFATGAVSIPLDRSAWVSEGGVRQQVNEITAFIDASNVYGSEHERALALRTLDGTGRLASSAGDMLPYNEAGLPNTPTNGAEYFLAGDVRANEQVGLTAMHTLFLREHNYWATLIASHYALDGDTIYEWARAIVAAEMQAITYREFLPLLLGEGALAPYSGYQRDVDPRIANSFATAAYRMGHTLLSPQLLRLDANGAHPSGPLSLAAAFNSPATFLETGPEPLLRGLAAQVCQELDPWVIDEVRNFLFGPPGAGGFDLASLNIQRGRDHGLPSYAELHAAFGRGELAGFAEVTSNTARARALADTYGSVQDIDAWIGLLCEDHVEGALVGPTLRAILADQFERLRDGDRFWYEAYLPPAITRFVHEQSLATIIRRNTSIGDELSDNVFVVTGH
ncbi:MAG: hypothetical protein DHS20C15_29170 [Planctomycetota bacterium]|nr:MAG: hypothetical protein DHS20C15_29170 [Planctomycetota bacterium]